MTGCKDCPAFFDCPSVQPVQPVQPQGTVRPLRPLRPLWRPKSKVDFVVVWHLDKKGHPVVDCVEVISAVCAP